MWRKTDIFDFIGESPMDIGLSEEKEPISKILYPNGIFSKQVLILTLCQPFPKNCSLSSSLDFLGSILHRAHGVSLKGQYLGLKAPKISYK